jgi:hypothetical protein
MILGLLVFGGCAPHGHQSDTDADSVEAGTPRVEVDPCAWDFVDVTLGDTAAHPFYVMNAGDSDLHVLAVSARPDDWFEAQDATPTIAPGVRFAVQVTFTPPSYGEFEGELSIETDDPIAPTRSCEIRGESLGDLDDDGYYSPQDCDDDDANIYPGAFETWYDGVDEDCNGGSDFDQDGDGWESKVWNPDRDHGGGDCDDVNPGINPGATEIPYDGTDEDCDGGSDYP